MRPLKPYTKTKDSGVEWLGAVPEHWGVVRLGSVLRERGELNTDNRVTEVLSVLKGRGVIPYSEKGNIGNKKSDDITRYKIVRPGDIVMNCMNVIIGSVGMASHTGCLSPVYYVLVGRGNENSHYLNLIFQCPQFYKSLVRIGNGILAHRMRIPMELLKCEMFPIPPVAEQGAIVRYLDFVEARVRRLLAAKQKTVELLLEKRQATIHQAVVRGLNPQAPLKDSGVEWLGTVPSHWDVLRLRNVAEMRVSSIDKHTNENEVPVRLCNYVDVYKNEKIHRKMNFMKATATPEEVRRFRLKVGDVLITKDSEVWNDIGVPALVAETADDLVSGYHLALFRPFANKMSGGYLFRALQSKGVAYQFYVNATGFIRYGLTHVKIKSVRVPVPPLAEQAAIVAHLDKVTGDIDRAIAGIRREIELLNEYRTRLIADVVTGKVDVRTAAAAL